MKKLEHNGRVHDLPETIWELRLGPFLNLMSELREEHDEDDLSHQMRLVHIVSGLPMAEVEEMDFNAFIKLAELCTFDDFALPDAVTREEIGLDVMKTPITFEVEGETFTFQPDFAFNKIGTAAKVEDLLRGKNLMDNLHIVLALCAWRDGEVFDHSEIKKKAALMCRARMGDVYRPLFTCAIQGQSSTFISRAFGKSRSSQRAPQANSATSGTGTES